MALTGDQLTKLKSTHQRAACRFVSFPEREQTRIGTISPGTYTWSDMINIDPRHSWIDNSGSISLYGNRSLQHGGSASTGHSWTLTGEAGGAAAGSISGDSGTAITYYAPASGSGIDRIELQTDGSGSGDFGYIAYGGSSLNIGEVTSFHADIESGGWEMGVKAFGDCSGLERQKGILLVLDAYWNGSEDTFGGLQWSHGVFYGYVDRIRTIHEDSEQAYIELKLISPEQLLQYGDTIEVFFATSGSDEEVIISDLTALDAVWVLFQESGINNRQNVYIYNDPTSVTNLKLSRGPIWDVIADVAARTFSMIYSDRVGNIWCLPDPDIRWDDYGAEANEFTLTTELFESIDLQWEDVDDPNADPPNPTDPTVGQVVLTAVKADLSEISSKYPADDDWGEGPRTEHGGLICETQGTLDAWAQRYWYKLQPQLQADLSIFLMPVLDLYDWVGLTYTPDSNRITNTELGTPDRTYNYVTRIDFNIDPGMGTWRGSVSIRSQADQ